MNSWLSALFLLIALATPSSSSHEHHQHNKPNQTNVVVETQTQIRIPVTPLSVPIFAAKYSHHAHIYIGSPPQRRIVILDTGSRVLVFPCEPCTHCGRKHVSKTYFDPEQSSTIMLNDCDKCSFSSILSVRSESERCHDQ
jgi:hypothetical protein